MDKKIEIVDSHTLYDDGSAYKEACENFTSTVYDSYQDYLTDLGWTAQNENYTYACGMMPTKFSKKRSPEERSRILVMKIEAERRLEQHYDEGGTKACFVSSFSKENAPH